MPAVWVYALRFEDGAIYVGLTKEIARRMEEHSRRQSPSTRKFLGDFSLIYSREFKDYVTARQHEKYLKSGAGRQFLKGVKQ